MHTPKNTAQVLSSKPRIAIALTTLMILALTANLSVTFAQYTKMPDRDTQTNVGVSPTLIGLSQQVLINVMVYPGPSGPTYEGQTLVQMQNNLGIPAGYENVSVTITDPDGTKETFMPIDITLESHGTKVPGLTQIVGHLMFFYLPKKVGNYSVTASFPGKTYTTDYISSTIKLSVFYKPSNSAKPTTFTVQEDLVSGGILDGAPWPPLPTNYWESPVQTDNREWAAISGDWPQISYDIMGTNYNPYSRAPRTPHIVWSRTEADAGLPGGIWGSKPYIQSAGQYPTQSYVADTVIILDGKIYRNSRAGYFEAIDLRTGTRLWEAPQAAGTYIGAAQRLDLPFQTETQVSEGGISSWLWGGIAISTFGGGSDKWYRYSTFNGDLLQTITNVPKDLSSVRFEDGDSIVWVVQSVGQLSGKWNTTLPLKIPYVNLIKWNFSKLITTTVYSQSFSSNWLNGIEWNVSAVQSDFVSIGDSNFRAPLVMPFRDANTVVVRNPNAMQIMAGYDYKTGAFLWKNNHTVLNIDILLQPISTSTKGPMFMVDSASPNYVAYDVKTGQEIYRISTGELPWSQVPAYTYVYDKGAIFLGSQDGHVYAYNTTGGEKIWQSDYVGATNENVVGTMPFNGRSLGADGILYYSGSTEYQLMPRTRFLALVAINETTGKFMWKLPIGIQPKAIADGYLVGEDIDNGIRYMIGKGKTATTITSSPEVSVQGRTVLIKGTVMDMSPGKPNTPAVSDADMSIWMDYLYGQNATLINNPPSPRGVPVTLSVLDANNNFRNIGTTTSNSDGFFSFQWTPDIPGTYTVYAAFAGSESYWPSHAVNAFAVEPAQPSPQEPQVQPSMTDTYVLGGVAAVIIVIVIVGALILLMLRRRP